MSVGEQAIVRINPELAYGSTGIPTLVPPNSPVEVSIELLDVQPPTLNIDFDNIANADNTPVSNSFLKSSVTLMFVQYAVCFILLLYSYLKLLYPYPHTHCIIHDKHKTQTQYHKPSTTNNCRELHLRLLQHTNNDYRKKHYWDQPRRV